MLYGICHLRLVAMRYEALLHSISATAILNETSTFVCLLNDFIRKLEFISNRGKVNGNSSIIKKQGQTWAQYISGVE